LPKNFDVYVYEEMNSWLRYKPTMALPHFRDLMHPNDCNYRPMSVSVEDLTSGDESMRDAAVHTYSNAAASAAASDCNPIPEEVDASAGGNQNVHTFPSPPPPTASAEYLQQWPSTSPIPPYPQRPSTSPIPPCSQQPNTSPIPPCPQRMPGVDLNNPHHRCQLLGSLLEG
jgi:hypothetical protein